MLSYQLKDLSLYVCHGLHDKGKTQLLVVLWEGKEWALVVQLNVEVLEGVQLNAKEVESV